MSILTKAKKGDNQAFTELMERFKLPMYKTAKSILKDEDDVCDALQEALFSIYDNLSSLKNEKYLKTWIIRITINKCYDLISKNNSNEKKVLKFGENYHEKCGVEDNIVDKTDLERALKEIDNDLRTVTILYYYNDMAVTDIADVLGIPSGTVKSKLSRAREKLLNILKEGEVIKDE